MILADIPATATVVSPGVWTDAVSRQRYYLDPTDASLVVARAWTPAELATWLAAQNTAATQRANLLAAIAAGVASLRSTAGTADAFITSENARATYVGGQPLANITPQTIRDELAVIHTDLATLATGLKLALSSTADLGVVVSDTL
jgi:hypothetical protein